MTLEDLFDAIAAAQPAPRYPEPGSQLLAADLEARRHTPGRVCAIPGGPAAAAPVIYVQPGPLFPSPRWLDVCWLHYGSIKELLLWAPDAQLADRYAAWVVAGAARRIAAAPGEA